MLDNIIDKDLYRKSKRAFEKRLNENEALNALFSSAAEAGDLYLVGGFIRDTSTDARPHDIDIVADTRKGDLLSSLGDLDYSLNRFGGYRLNLQDDKIDLWTLDDTWAFRNGYISSSPENLSSSSLLNIDSAVINLTTGDYNLDGLLCALKDRELRLSHSLDISRHNPNPRKSVRRIFEHAINYQLSISDDVFEFIKIAIERDPIIISQILDYFKYNYQREACLRISEFTTKIFIYMIGERIFSNWKSFNPIESFSTYDIITAGQDNPTSLIQLKSNLKEWKSSSCNQGDSHFQYLVFFNMTESYKSCEGRKLSSGYHEYMLTRMLKPGFQGA